MTCCGAKIWPHPTARLPAGLGHEMAGVVTKVGEGVSDLSVGDKVASFPGQSPNDYPTYGELIVMPRSALTRYPDVLTPIEASVHYTPLLIAYFAYVDLAKVKPGQTVLITDASHCAGPSFVQLGKALGVKVIAATKDVEERDCLLALGADHVIVTEEQDLLMQINKLTDSRGVDVVLDGWAARKCRCSVMCSRRVAVWCSMVCKAGQSHPVPGVCRFSEEHSVFRSLYWQFHG